MGKDARPMSSCVDSRSGAVEVCLSPLRVLFASVWVISALTIATTLAVPAPAAFADSPRVFEQVTPPGSGAYSVGSPQLGAQYYSGKFLELDPENLAQFDPLESVSPDGSDVVYSTKNGVIAGADPNVSGLFRASRGAGGWSTQWVSPGQPVSPSQKSLPTIKFFQGASLDGSAVVFTNKDQNAGEGVSLDPADPTALEPHSPLDLYEQSGPGSSAWISRGPLEPATEYQDVFDGISADGGTVVWESREAIMPGQPDLGLLNIYERSGGVTSRVSVVSDGTSPENGDSGVHFPTELRRGHAVSLDGSRIFFSSREKLAPAAPSDGSLSLYMRSGAQTTLIAAGSDQAASNRVEVGYEDATPDGSHVYYTLTSRETGAQELYDYNVATATSSPVAVDQATGELSTDPNQRVGYVTSSSDGSHVYFVSEAPLDPANQKPTQQNYGLFERVGGPTGQTRFIASLPDLNGFTGCAGGYTDGLTCRVPVYSARVSTSGSRLFFTTLGRLTPDAQRPATDAHGNPLYDVYVYDDTTHQITRVSQGPSGGDGLYSATMGIFPTAHSGIQGTAHGVDPRDISADGSRVFFSTAEKLTPDAADNAKQKVYQWDNGTTTLVSPSNAGGASPAQAIYADNSVDGADVFFSTTDSLSCADTDGGRSDIYDARIGGTAATCPAPSVPCQASNTCAAVALESGLTPASSLFSGPGDQPVIVNRLAGAKITPPTRAQKLAKALKACRKKVRKQRRVCESQARKKYGNKFKAKKSSSHPGHASGRAGR